MFEKSKRTKKLAQTEKHPAEKGKPKFAAKPPFVKRSKTEGTVSLV